MELFLRVILLLLTSCCSDFRVFCVGRYEGSSWSGRTDLGLCLCCMLARGLMVYTWELGLCESVSQHWIGSETMTKYQMESRLSPGQTEIDRFRLGGQECPVELAVSSLAHIKFLQMFVSSGSPFSIGHMPLSALSSHTLAVA